MANSSFFKNTGTSSQIQSSIGASSITATNAAAAASTSATAAATSAASASNSATAASTSAAAASASSSSASTSATSSSTASSNAQDWAVKTTGLVDSTDYASKAWAVGGTGVTGGSGASKEWATTLGSTVDGSEYSSKHYAQEAATDAAQVATDAAQVASDRIQTGQDATNTAASAVAASSSAVSAAASAASAASTFDLFDDRFLGSKTGFITPLTGPSVDNDGNALVSGTLFFSADANEMRVYDGSGWIAASSSGTSSLTNYNYTATASQTAFTGADDNSNTLSYTVDNLIVTRNGVVLEDGTDYTATNGTSIVLAVAATAGDEINVVAFKSFTTADMVSATNGGTFQNNVTVNGTMTATAFSGDGSALTNLPAAGISDVVQDTTPQLGGNLDTNGNNITFGDSDKAIFGAGADLEISHNGTENVIDSNAGTLVLRSAGAGTIELRDQGSQVLAQFNDNADAKLYYNNNLKIATTATGCDVTGTVTADGLTVSGDAVFTPDNDGVRITGANYATLRLEENDTTDLNTTMFNSGGKFAIFTSSDDRASATERVTLDHSSGNFGIGTSSADETVQVFQTAASGNNYNQGTLKVGGSTTALGFQFGYHSISSGRNVITSLNNGGGSNQRISIGFGAVNSSGEPATNVMTLNQSGKAGIGTTSISSTLEIVPPDSGTIIETHSFSSSAQNHMQMRNNSGTEVGSIYVTTTSTSYNETSDYRLKTAVNYDWDATSRLKQLKPARFKWIANGDDAVPVDGFLAHEVSHDSDGNPLVPQAVHGTKDGMRDEEYEVTPAVLDDDGNEVTPAVMGTRSVPDYQQIDQSKIVPLLVKTIQELEARIAALETN